MQITSVHVAAALIGSALIGGITLAVNHVVVAGTDDVGFRQGSVGSKRLNRLEAITKVYRQEHPASNVLAVNGLELAPLSYLNAELQEQQAPWRVRIVDGELAFQEVT